MGRNSVVIIIVVVRWRGGAGVVMGGDFLRRDVRSWCILEGLVYAASIRLDMHISV